MPLACLESYCHSLYSHTDCNRSVAVVHGCSFYAVYVRATQKQTVVMSNKKEFWERNTVLKMLCTILESTTTALKRDVHVEDYKCMNFRITQKIQNYTTSAVVS